jgi:apolipoprotein N-acyltransferase
MTPYPKVFVPIDNLLGGLMGRNVGQKEVSLLNFSYGGKTVPTGCAICYESVYGEHCAEYVRKGAKLLTVITNDAWWGDTPGYRQHLSYSSLRAIETRRDIARCANTGISAIINQKGQILESSPWWETAVIRSKINLTDGETFFVRNGDIAGRICSFMFLLLLLAMVVRLIVPSSMRRN